MISRALLLGALLSSIHGAPVNQPTNQGITYGSAEPAPLLSQWLPPQRHTHPDHTSRQIYLSFDGMHQFDLTNYISKYPNRRSLEVLKTAVVYSNARTSFSI